MGNLSNLYISQSYQSLIHLGTDSSATSTPTELQDGLGNGIGVYVNTAGELSASVFSGSVAGVGNVSSFSASVNSRIIAATNEGQFLTTSSFNSYTQSNDTKVDNLNTISASYLAFTQSYYIDSASFSSRIEGVDDDLVTTASFNAYTQSTNNRLDSLESKTGSYATTGSNTFIGNQTINGDISSSGTLTVNVISASSAQITYLHTIYESSSVVYSSGSNQLGDELTDTQILSGSVLIVGNGSINGSPIIVSSQTSSMAVSSSTYAVTASYALNAQTASEARNLIVIARNGNQSTLSAGTVVHITSASGDNPIFNTASFDTEALSANTLGVIRTTTTSGADCEVVVNGIATGVDTDPSLGYVAGDIIYLSSSGQFTRVQPQAPQQIVVLGQVLRAQQNNGSIYVNISNGWELDELHNVRIISASNWDLLVYNSSSQLWENSSSAEIGLATTGSNTFNGNQTINGTVQISSSATYDLDITGAWQASQNSRISSSVGVAQIGPTAVSITSGSSSSNFLGRGYVSLNLDGNQLGIYSSGSTTIGGVSTAPIGSSGIFIKSGSVTNAFYYPIQFQSALGYTDGRVTITTPLSASAGITSSDAFINGELYSVTSASIDSRLDSLEAGSSSISTSVGLLQTFSSSQYKNDSSSFDSRILAAGGTLQILDEGSILGNATSLNFTGAGVSVAIASNTASVTISGASFDTASFATTGSNSFVGNQTITGSVIISSSSDVDLTVIGNGVVSGNLDLSGNFTSSLQEGYVWVGGAGNRSVTVSTSSFGGGGTIDTSSFATTGSNSFVGDQTITGSLIISSSQSTGLIITGAAKIVSNDSLQINTIGPNTFNINTTADASVNAENYIFGSTGSVASIYVGVYDSPNFTTDIELQLSADINGLSFNDWDNVDGAYESWLTLAPNVGNNPVPTFTRGLEVTGSTNIAELTASLQEGYVWVGNASGKTTTVATSSFGGGAAFPYTGSAIITGSLLVTGSQYGNVVAVTVSSGTASIDFSLGNSFTLTLPSSSTTVIDATNIKAGQTINLLITQPATTGAVSFTSEFKFQNGADYQASASGSAVDLLSFATFDTTSVYATAIKNLF